jgi:hypothetical protein
MVREKDRKSVNYWLDNRSSKVIRQAVADLGLTQLQVRRRRLDASFNGTNEKLVLCRARGDQTSTPCTMVYFCSRTYFKATPILDSFFIEGS